MANSNVVPAEVSYATNAMMVGEPYKGVLYTSLQLSGRPVAKPADRHGDGILLPQLVTTYWPGGADGVPPESVMTADFIGEGEDDDGAYLTDTVHEMAYAVHRQIFGMDLANTTLRAWRYKADPLARNTVDYDVLGISYGQYVPLGGVAISQVVAHNQLRTGAYVANLYFPDRTTYPVFVLNAIKTALPVNNGA